MPFKNKRMILNMGVKLRSRNRKKEGANTCRGSPCRPQKEQESWGTGIVSPGTGGTTRKDINLKIKANLYRSGIYYLNLCIG